jgi:ribosomal protein S18 acetylase RimI-like enzyme
MKLENTMQAHEPVQLEPSQRDQAAELLARAFHNDPLYMLVMPEDDKRAAALQWLFERVVHYCLLYGQLYTTPALEGVAGWLPPGQTRLTAGRVVWSGLYATPLRMGLAAYRRFDAYMSYADRLHGRYAPESHWYLWVLGVDPPSQGKGIGGRLIQPVLARASADGTACYLETEMERNVRFYEKYGFKIVGEGTIPRHGLQVWAMLREPTTT